MASSMGLALLDHVTSRIWRILHCGISILPQNACCSLPVLEGLHGTGSLGVGVGEGIEGLTLGSSGFSPYDAVWLACHP